VRSVARTSIAHGVVLLLAAVLFSGACVPASAAPTNAAIRKKRSQAEAAERKMEDLAATLELRGEELAQIEDAVAKTRREISATEADLRQANADLAASQQQLDHRASSIYRNGGISMVSVLVGASDFGDLVNRLDLMRRIGDNDAAMVASVKDAKARVEATELSLETRQAEQLALRTEARHKANQVADALEEQQRYTASLKADLKTLIEKERKRQEAIAAKLKAEAQARAKQIARRGNRTFNGQLGASHPEVVRIAERYLGVPYVWGGTSPRGFDCSGLMQYCYAQIGINLPRTSSVQFHYGDYIPPDRLDLLEPGDLVFFGYGGDPGQVHHVGMYVGGGNMIEAPYTGARVRRASLIARINSRGDYVGASRP
jgi:peptidoglycan DL-endopeptidase CwlO